MGQYGIRHTPINRQKVPLKFGEKRGDRAKNPTPKFTCCLSGEVLPATSEELVSYIHHDNQRIDFSYERLLDILKKTGKNYFKISHRREKDFNIIDFFNVTRETILKAKEKGNLDPVKLENTLIGVNTVLDATRLSSFIVGGSSAFLPQGLIVSNFPKPGK
jgi:hypothetical protein